MSAPRSLVRGKSSTSLVNESKKKPLKQFTAGGIKAHNRNSSTQFNKLNKLSRISSAESFDVEEEPRPTMARSKSSDGVVLKRNRSKRKLVGLAPLTKTMSNQSQMGTRSKQSTRHTGEESGSEEEVDTFDENPTDDASPDQVPHQPQQQSVVSEEQDIDSSMPKYFGNILSQSTGVEKNVGNGGNRRSPMLNFEVGAPSPGNEVTAPLPSYPSKTLLNQITESAEEPAHSVRYTHPMSRDANNDSGTSIQSSNLIFQPSSTNIARQYKNQLESKDAPSSEFTKNFREFLNKSPELQTRTQQKLWLQRESSILDLSQGSKQFPSNSAQFRTEFEKFSREYLNVRRYVNPVAASLKRIELCGCKIARPQDKFLSSSKFDEFAPGAIDRIRASHTELNDIWESGWKHHNTSSTSLDHLTKQNTQAHSQSQPQFGERHLQKDISTNTVHHNINNHNNNYNSSRQPNHQTSSQSNVSYFQQRPKQKSTNNFQTTSQSQMPMTKAVAKNEGATIV